MENDNEHTGPQIKLDGSAGLGGTARLTLTTKDDSADGEKNETFVFPLSLINMDMLNKAVQFNFILGYNIIRSPRKATDEDVDIFGFGRDQ